MGIVTRPLKENGVSTRLLDAIAEQAAAARSARDSHAYQAALDRLREAEPVSWVPALGGWLVTGYAEARQMLSPRLWVSP